MKTATLGFFLAGLLVPVGVVAAEPVLPRLHLVYDVSWNGIPLGEGIITLSPHDEPDCYTYDSVTNPVGVVRMFYGRPHDRSTFCIRNGKVVPWQFDFVNPKDPDENFRLAFDQAAGKVNGGVHHDQDIPSNAQDRFGMQQAVRLWVLEHLDDPEPGSVEFTLVDDRRVKPYRFTITGKERIQTPAGAFDTVVVERIDDPKKSTKFWLAPERDYMPVRFEQLKGGDANLRMVLRPDLK